MRQSRESVRTVEGRERSGAGISNPAVLRPFAVLLLGLVCGCGGLSARLEMKSGNESYLRGDYENAIRHYDTAVQRVPDHSQAHLNRAYSYVALSRQQGSDLAKRREFALKAVDSFQNYLKAVGGEVPEDSELPGPERVEQHVLTLYLDSGQPDKAIEYLEAKLARDPRDLPALQMLSTISADRGDLETASRWLRKRVELEPDSPEAYYSYGVFAWRASYYNQTTDDSLRARLIDEGIHELETALRIKPDYFEALSYMTLLYREKAKTATDPAEIQLAETRAQEFHNRAVELRKKSEQDSTSVPGSLVGSR